MHDNGIEELITKLYDMVQDARSLPLGADKCIVEAGQGPGYAG